MSKILDNNADFQSLLENAPEMPDSDGIKNEEFKSGSVFLTIGVTLIGIIVLGAIMQHHSERVIANIRLAGRSGEDS